MSPTPPNIINEVKNKSKELTQRVRARVQYSLYTMFSKNGYYSSAESLSRQVGLNITQEYNHPQGLDYNKLNKRIDQLRTQDPAKIQDEIKNLLNKYIPLNPELSQAVDLSKPQYQQFVLNGIASKFTIKDIQFFCTVITDHSKLSEKEAYDQKRNAFFDRFGIQEMSYCPHPDTIDKIENFILNAK